MASTDDQILELNDTILSRDTTIGLRDATIASKDDVISQRNNLIAEQNATILTQGDSITELQNRVSELESSPDELRELIDERWTEIDWTDPGAKDTVSALWSEVKEAAQAKGYGNEKLGELASWIAALVVGSGENAGTTREVLEALAEGTGVVPYTLDLQTSEAEGDFTAVLDIKKATVSKNDDNLGLTLYYTIDFKGESEWMGYQSIILRNGDDTRSSATGMNWGYKEEVGCECHDVSINFPVDWAGNELKVLYNPGFNDPNYETQIRFTIIKTPLSDSDIVLAAAANPKAAGYEANMKDLAYQFYESVYWWTKDNSDSTWGYNEYKWFISSWPMYLIGFLKNQLIEAGYDEEKIENSFFEEKFKKLFRYANKSISYSEEREVEETTAPEKVSGPVLISYLMYNGHKASDEELTGLTNWENANWTPYAADDNNWASDSDRTLYGINYVKEKLGIEPVIDVYWDREENNGQVVHYTDWDEFWTAVKNNRDFTEAWYRFKVDLSSVTMYDVSGFPSNNTEFSKDTDSDPESDEARYAFRVSDEEIVVRQEGYYSEDKHCNQILYDVDRGTVTHVWFEDDREGDITAVNRYNKKFYGGCLNDLAELTGVTLEDGESESDSERNVRKIADAVRALKQE